MFINSQAIFNASLIGCFLLFLSTKSFYSVWVDLLLNLSSVFLEVVRLLLGGVIIAFKLGLSWSRLMIHSPLYWSLLFCFRERRRRKRLGLLLTYSLSDVEALAWVEWILFLCRNIVLLPLLGCDVFLIKYSLLLSTIISLLMLEAQCWKLALSLKLLCWSIFWFVVRKGWSSGVNIWISVASFRH